MADVTARVASDRAVAIAVAAAAAGRFRDPLDVLALADLGAVTVDASGAVDPASVTKLLDDLAKAKPYLLAADVKPATGARAKASAEAARRFGARQPNPTGGPAAA